MASVSADRFDFRRVSEPGSTLGQGDGFGPGLDEEGTGIIAFVIGHRPEQRAIIQLEADRLMGNAEPVDFVGIEVTDGDNGATEERFQFGDPLG